jgi:hypothetical protein
MKTYKAMCLHPTCRRREDCIHCKPHAYDEEKCEIVNCGMLEEASCCDIVVLNENKEIIETIDINHIRRRLRKEI